MCLATFVQCVCEIGPNGCTSFLCSISPCEYPTLYVKPMGFFHVGAIMNSAVLSILAHEFCGTIAFVYVGYILRRRIARS